MHLAALERAFGRVFAVIALLFVLQFWFSARTVSGQTPGSVAASALLSLLLIWLAIPAFRRMPSQRDLYLLAAGTGILLPASRMLAVPGSPFLAETAYLLVAPVAGAWPALSRRFVVLVPVVLTVLATGAWDLRGDLPVEQAVTTLATAALMGFSARFMRAGAQRADKDADQLSRELARQDAALAAEEAERRAANAVHDDVLSVLRAVSLPDQLLPWTVLVSKARRAQSALSLHLPAAGGRGSGGLGPALRSQVLESAAGLNVRCVLEGDLVVPAPAADAISAAVGEALRNVAAYAQVRSATVMASDQRAGGVRVVISDAGVGFDPGQVRPASTGLRNSVQARLRDAGGSAEVISSPGNGTAVVLTWSPPPPAGVEAVDLLAWARRLAPRPLLVFAGFMLPPLLSSLVVLCLRWQDMRWHLASVAVFLGLLGLAAGSARNVNRVRMTRLAWVGRTAAVTILVATGSLAVAPGTTDAFAYWVSGESAILMAVLYFLGGTRLGLAALALDLAALTAGLLVTGTTIPRGAWVGILASPVLGAGLAAGVLAAFRGLSNYTESRLAEYREGLRRQARAEAVSLVDSAAVENARRVAGPVLSQVAAGQPPSAALRMAAALASAMLRDELLAPGFLTAALADRVRTARTAGARVTVDIAQQGNPDLMETARRLLAAALANASAVDDVTLQVHPPTDGHPALLILHVHTGEFPASAALRRGARECGALVTDLDDHELLVRLQPGPQDPASTAP